MAAVAVCAEEGCGHYLEVERVVAPQTSAARRLRFGEQTSASLTVNRSATPRTTDTAPSGGELLQPCDVTSLQLICRQETDSCSSRPSIINCHPDGNQEEFAVATP